MPNLPTSTERTDAALTIARTKAAAYADTGDTALAYKALLRGVQYAQRVNSSSETQSTLAGLWTVPAVKAATLGAAAAISTAITRSKVKSKPDTKSTSRPASNVSSTPVGEASMPRQGRFRRLGKKTTTVPETGRETTKVGDSTL